MPDQPGPDPRRRPPAFDELPPEFQRGALTQLKIIMAAALLRRIRDAKVTASAFSEN